MGSQKTEILAPVGNFESLSAAVRCGADAVYFGYKDFSARRNAVNFSLEEMKEAVKYCKSAGVKAYLTLNIAIKDNETEEAFDIAKSAYLSGVDGLIVSDLGLADMIHKALPEIELHASTQMSINSPSGLKILKELGFCRVVPAREMSKKELAEFCAEAKKLNMEVEVFVHGALCMCLSGQCLLSSVLGARSGNRGLCAGPCRLPFGVKNGTGYDLSLKDLSLISHIGELADMGVTSFKIEGRMKRPEYIAATVTACRNMVDNGAVPEELNEMLKNVFSRSGFTDGYFTEKLGKNMFGTRNKDDVIKSKETYAFLHNLYRNEFSRIPVNIRLEIKENKPVKLEISSEKYAVSVLGKLPEYAENVSVTKEAIIKQISKLGGTPYYLETAEIDIQNGLFFSNKDLNELRRKAVSELTEKYSEIPDRKVFSFDFKATDKKRTEKPKIYAKFLDLKEIPNDLSGVEMLIIPLEKVGEDLPEFKNIAVEIPKFTCNENYIKEKLKIAEQKGIKTAFCDTLSALETAKEMSFETIGGIGLNVLNEKSANVLKRLGVKGVMLSAEMLLKRANSFKFDGEKGIFAYGRLPLMAFKNCPLKNGRECKDCDKQGVITDRKNTEFPIRCRAFYSEMFNSKPIYIADRLSEICNVDFLVLSFTTESSAEAKNIVERYLFSEDPINDYTRGLYYRDVL
ncbi:MAG: U32 family peptidase [Clostridia bacterium]|nr:U32 family peptidase [Clostridia bacterium]